MEAERLHVGAADALAKARRAAEASSVTTVVLGGDLRARMRREAPFADAADGGGGGGDGRAPRAPRPPSGMSAGEYARLPRFGEARDAGPPPPPGALQAVVRRLFEVRKAGKGGEDVDAVLREKVVPVVEKVAAVVSGGPDPTVGVLGGVLVLLAVHVLRPGVVGGLRWLGVAGVSGVMAFGFLPVAAVWGRTDMFAVWREGGSVLAHPAEGVMDGMEAALTEREGRVAAEAAKLKAARVKLEALKRELWKDPAAVDPTAELVPGRKAIALIKAGALGEDGLAVRDAAAAEASRRAMAKARGQEDWRARNMEAEGDEAGTKEHIRMLGYHAGSVYPRRTKELKAKAGGGAPTSGPDRLKAKAGAALSALPGRHLGGGGSFSSSPAPSPGLSASSAPAGGGASPPAVRIGGSGRRHGRAGDSGGSRGSRSVASSGATGGGRDGKTKRRLFRSRKRKEADAGSAAGGGTEELSELGSAV